MANKESEATPYAGLIAKMAKKYLEDVSPQKLPWETQEEYGARYERNWGEEDEE